MAVEHSPAIMKWIPCASVGKLGGILRWVQVIPFVGDVAPAEMIGSSHRARREVNSMTYHP